MQPVLTTAQSRTFDKYLIEEIGIPSLVLMENAARGALEAIEDLLLPKVRIAIICGPGNNGGDGLALARLLVERGIRPMVLLASEPENLSKDAKLQYDILNPILDPESIHLIDDIEIVFDFLSSHYTDSPDIIVDALLGTGSSGELRGAVKEAAEAIAHLKRIFGSKVISLDIPTGFDADKGSFEADIEARIEEYSPPTTLRADRTIAMGAPKIGFYQAESRLVTGDIFISKLGLPYRNKVFGDGLQAWIVEKDDIVKRLPKFPYYSSKFTRGRVLTICGSRGMTGAAIMSGMSALKSGCGMVTVAIPESERAIVSQAMPELMTVGLKNENNGSPDIKAWEELKSYFNRTEVVLIGCGLPVMLGTTALILKIISEVDKPMVIDAGALGTLTGHLDILKKRTVPTILTPHSGEIARLIDRPLKEVERDRLNVAREVAAMTGCIVVMKGAPTYTIESDGTAYINTTGNVGLATAGSGDVLSGITASLLAQMPDKPKEAAMSAVYLHGLAGDFAAKDKTTHSMTATDIIAYLPQAFKSLGIE